MIRISYLKFFLVLFIVPSALMAKTPDLSFFSSDGIATYFDKTKTSQENANFILSLIDKKLIKSIETGVDAQVPISIGGKYLLPKPAAKFYVFSNSRFLGETFLKGYEIIPDRFSEDTATFNIDWEKLNLTKKDQKEAEEDAVLVCPDVNSTGTDLTQSIDIQKDTEMVEVSEKDAAETIKLGLHKLKPHECPAPNEYKMGSAYDFKRDSVEVIDMLSTCVCGENEPAIVIVKHDGVVNVIRDETMRRVSFDQYFRIADRKFIVVFKSEDLGEDQAVYEITPNKVVLITEYSML
jgi:hypothetical protein